MQVALNDLARVLLGVQRKDKICIATLTNKVKLPTVIEIVVRQSALAAWKAANIPGCPLIDIATPFDTRTRGATKNLQKPKSTRCIAAKNLTEVWNTELATDLREATTLTGAKKAAARLAHLVRFL